MIFYKQVLYELQQHIPFHLKCVRNPSNPPHPNESEIATTYDLLLNDLLSELWEKVFMWISKKIRESLK